MPRLTGYRSTPPDLAERKLEQLDAIVRQSIRATDNRTNGEHVNGFYFSSAKGIRHERKTQRMAFRTGVFYMRHAAPAYSAARPDGCLSLPESRFERTDDVSRQGLDAQRRLRTARSGVRRARPFPSETCVRISWHISQRFSEGAPRPVPDAHCSHPSLECAAKCSVIVTDAIIGRVCHGMLR